MVNELDAYRDVSKIIESLNAQHSRGIVVVLEEKKVIDIYSPYNTKPDLKTIPFFYIYKEDGWYRYYEMKDKYKEEFLKCLLQEKKVTS